MLFTPRTPRVVAARRLQRRRDRETTGRFLAEGPQAVREALARPGVVTELFGTPAALDRYADLVARAADADVPVSPVTDEGLAALAETVAPQGLVAVCRHLDIPRAEALAAAPRLVAVLAEIRDPGNAGTVLRTADAAGAGPWFAGTRSTRQRQVCGRRPGLFHVDVVRADPLDVPRQAAGLRARDRYGDSDLDTSDTGGSPPHRVDLRPGARLPEADRCRDARVRFRCTGARASTWLRPRRSACTLQREHSAEPSTGRARHTSGESSRP
jgi:TrmH family RNA methyltransferase